MKRIINTQTHGIEVPILIQETVKDRKSGKDVLRRRLVQRRLAATRHLRKGPRIAWRTVEGSITVTASEVCEQTLRMQAAGIIRIEDAPLSAKPTPPLPPVKKPAKFVTKATQPAVAEPPTAAAAKFPTKPAKAASAAPAPEVPVSDAASPPEPPPSKPAKKS